MKTTTWTTLALLSFGLPAAAQEFTATLDVPGDLGGATYLANQTFHHEGAAYQLEFDGPAAGLGPGVNINALDLLEDGGFLFSCDAPCDAQGTTYTPRDVVRYSAGAYSLYLDGAALGLSAGADIDALTRDAAGDLIVSFSAAETIGGTTYMPGDLAKISSGALALFFDGVGAGFDREVDLVGAEAADNGHLFLQFDTPVQLGPTTYHPGEIVEYDGVDFWLYYSDVQFPAGAAAADFGLPASPGEAELLLLAKNGPDVDLSWSAGCSGAVDDFAVYEGSLGSFASHLPALCSTAGATSATVTPAAGDRYFIVVPRNGSFEGSYGADSQGGQRGAQSGACVTRQKVRPCA